jgi:hypothetical protein
MSKPPKNNNLFNYTMMSAKAAFHSLIERIKNKVIFNYKPYAQKKSKEIRYTKKNDFNEKVVIEFFKKKINLHSKKNIKKYYKRPFFLK